MDGGKGFRARPYTSICSGKWKLIYYYEDKNVELFNLEEDIKEEHDVSSVNPDVVSDLKGKIFDWIDETQAPVPTKPNSYYDCKQ